MKLSRILLALAVISVVITSCGSSNSARPITAEDVFNKGLEEFNDDDYYEARKYFEKIKLQYPASTYADDAYYYLAEINYQTQQYIVASYHYNSLRRTHPQSEYGKKALYKTALCYYNLSPTFDRDQEYTLKAIRAFAEFQAFYPDDSLAAVSTEKIVELRNKMAQRQYETGEFYFGALDDPKASIIYYDKVIEGFQDTDFFEEAYYGKIRALMKMQLYDEAESIIDLYKKTFPDGTHINEVKDYLEEIPK